MAYYEIPVDPEAYDQALTVQLGGTDYDLRLLYSERAARYYLDISEGETAILRGQSVVLRLNMLTNTDIDGQLYVLPLDGLEMAPELGELGIDKRCTMIYETDD